MYSCIPLQKGKLFRTNVPNTENKAARASFNVFADSRPSWYMRTFLRIPPALLPSYPHPLSRCVNSDKNSDATIIRQTIYSRREVGSERERNMVTDSNW